MPSSFPLWFGWYHPYSGQAFLGGCISLTHIPIIQETPRRILYQFSRCLSLQWGWQPGLIITPSLQHIWELSRPSWLVFFFFSLREHDRTLPVASHLETLVSQILPSFFIWLRQENNLVSVTSSCIETKFPLLICILRSWLLEYSIRLFMKPPYSRHLWR